MKKIKLILFLLAFTITANAQQDTIANTSFRAIKNLEFGLNINNLTDKQYFTKRPTFYPGPGVWPSEGRNFSGSFIIRL